MRWIARSFSYTLLSIALLLVGTNFGQQKTPVESAGQSKPDERKTPSTQTVPGGSPQVKTESAQTNQESLQLSTQLVNVTATVLDPYGRFVTGLDKTNFEVYEDKVKQDIIFFNDDDAPVSIGIIFDVSGSMKHRINRSHEALGKFIDSCHPDDDFFLVGFSSGAKIIRDFTVDGHGIANALTLIEPDGQTALYDAAYIGVEKARQGRHKRKALIIISDGQDNNSRYTYQELRKIIKEADVQIYALGITDPGTDDLAADGEAILEEIARTTGGRAFFPHNEVDLEDSITRIALELRHQYSLAYIPKDNKQDGQWHKLRVVVTPPKGLPHLTVTAREGYFRQKQDAPVVKQ